ncbi:hypothetical protein F0562_034916 [Nyssa sinensis]|uniref:Pre-mRNA polyadenylation factor Fip1 domain-containing protein n=1 Tax=Nyssa sinensis TaxID=561372 RepID=A0A5J5AAP3_9ASTE|nr:hypothetical protein F0562_034916 [Nyssa sinensis]
MEDIDDDFGDLYADVEVKASAAIRGLPNFSRFNIEQGGIDLKGSDLGSKKVDSIGDELIQSGRDDEAKKILSVDANGEEVIEDVGSDSEDDLNIVLNDDDNGSAFPIARGVNLKSGGFDDEEESGDLSVVAEGKGSGKNRKLVDQSQLADGMEQSSNGLGGGEKGNGSKGAFHSQYLQYKYIRPPKVAFPNNAKANGSMGLASYSSSLVRGDWEDNGSNQCAGSISVGAQPGYNFLLPWYRTILDVNIDMLEWKPWRHPGTDTTDFFNFGFNEESWKHYCNCLEQFRQQTSTLGRNPVNEPSKPYEKACEVGSEHGMGAQEAVAEKNAQTGQGRTISQSSKIPYREMKQLEMPRGRAIQVKDSITERQPSFNARRPLDLDSDVVIQITVQDSMEDCSDSGKDELGHVDSSVHEASENEDLVVDDDREIHCFGGASGDKLHRESLAENVKPLDTAVPKRCSQSTTASNPVSMDSDDHGSGHISDVDRHHHKKLTVCTSERDPEAVETSNTTREGVGREMCKSAIMEIESSLAERSHHCLNSFSSGSHCEAPSDGAYIDPEKISNDLGRPSPNSVTELRESVTSDHYHSKDSKRHGVKTKLGDCKYFSRSPSPIPEDMKHYKRRLHSVSKLKSHPDDNDDASSMSKTEGLFNVGHSAVGHNRWKERLHGFDCYDGEHFSYYRESELPFNYRGERFSDSQVRTACTKSPHMKGHRTSGDETDLHLNTQWYEEEYFLQQRIARVGGAMDGDWYDYRRGHTTDESPFTCKESRRLASKHSSYLETGRATGWSRKGGELQFRKKRENDEFLVERKYTDDFVQGNSGRSVLHNDMERYSLDKYERHLPCTRGEFKSSGRIERKRDCLSIDLDNLWPRGDKYWRCTDHRSLSSRSYKEPHTANAGRWHDTTSPRNEVCDLRKTRRHGRYRRQIWTERCRGSYSDAFDTEESVNYPDDQVHFERRHHWHSDILHWTQNGNVSRHRDDEFHTGEASFSFERNSRHKKFDAKPGSDHVGKFIDERRAERHRYKILREGNSGICIDKSSFITHRGNYEKTLLSCEDSVDFHLVVGEGKSSGNGRHENMAWNIDKEQITSKNFNESHVEKTDREVESGQNDEEWHDKFPVTPRNEALDIEEGQIITEELNENLVGKKFTSENVARISDAKERILDNENAPDGNKVVGEYENHRILEMLAKMEKRRERFKEPITLKNEKDNIPKPLLDPVAETAEPKQQRPARKRRWGGS